MKLSTSVSAAIVVALATQVAAAPATVSEQGLSKREIHSGEVLIANINEFAAKRDLMTYEELEARDYAIVTEILSYISTTGLAPKIISGLVTDPTLGPIVTKAVVAIVKSGLVNLTTLLEALDQSGLAAGVIQDLISDCSFYQEIFQLAESYISNFISTLLGKVGLKKKDLLALPTPTQEQLERRAIPSSTLDPDGIVIQLLESLKESGLATSVVKSLITDKGFISWGADLIKQLFSSGAITLGELVTALEDSGIVVDLFKQFFTIDTLKTVAVNALAAAFGNCGGSSLVSSATKSGNVATTTKSTTTTTAGSGGSSCKRRRRSYNY
ncbi:hypothetical protein CLIB1423_10S01618 [[Candida] railenensis]|uniref:Opaque-phase-specific protein OP4 n=1 Tax=[Candida] railenensis TaxID=45579 RepID=A0A9P0VYR7_9ASCO|nr:hypothetical protein CLIB1423_10S01618 [[Candida] railenensis]